jgi:hypothetical protein
LVVVDVQNGFITESSAPIVARVTTMVRRWQAAAGAVFLSRYFNHPGSQFERLLGWTAVRHEPDTDLVDELLPLTGSAEAVIDKTIYSVFTDDGAALLGWVRYPKPTRTGATDRPPGGSRWLLRPWARRAGTRSAGSAPPFVLALGHRPRSWSCAVEASSRRCRSPSECDVGRVVSVQVPGR